MRFLINVIDTKSSSASAHEMAAIDDFNRALKENGHWILAAGIADPAKSQLIDNRQGAGIVENRPLIQNSEYVSGFWIIEATDEKQALEISLSGSLACNRKVELRPFLGN